MTKSQLVELLATKLNQLPYKDVELVIKTLLGEMGNALKNHRRIEVRGFGSFETRYRAPKKGRNPKTGKQLELPGKHVPHFKPGKEMREQVNQHYLKNLNNVNNG